MKKNTFLAVVLTISALTIQTVRFYADRRSVDVMAQGNRHSFSHNISLRDYAENRFRGLYS